MRLESHVPFPLSPGKRGKGRHPLYPFGRMAVGDSFVVPRSEADRAWAAASKWKIRHPGWNYTSRSEGEIVRLWRLA